MQQLRLGRGMRAVDVNASAVNIDVALREQHGVDGVARHQLLRLGRQRLGLLLEIRGVGLGQQTANLAQHLGVR